jgi:hypothetical protein
MANEIAKAPFPVLLEKFKGEIARALPRHLSGDRMTRIALTAFRRNPALGKCDPRSVFAAIIQASQLGLEPDTLGRAYLIPYGQECQFVPGWKGLVELANRSGAASVWTGAVYEGDEFSWSLGDSPYVVHRPCGEYDRNRAIRSRGHGAPGNNGGGCNRGYVDGTGPRRTGNAPRARANIESGRCCQASSRGSCCGKKSRKT